jgi:molybdopterin adenylyltransferase
MRGVLVDSDRLGRDPTLLSHRSTQAQKERDGMTDGPAGPSRAATVVTASDRSAAGQREDLSGPAVAGLLEGAGFVVRRELVPDDRQLIAALLRRLVDDDGQRLVVVTGGTGLGPRDVTPEATRDVIEREVPGLAEAMRAAGRTRTPMADLSRGVCGVRGATLIVDLPGSVKGATESLAAIVGLLPHALELLAGDTDHTA